MLDYIGTRILEVCECPESVTDRSNGFGRVLGGRTGQKRDWHLIPGSLRVSRKCRRPMHWLLEIHRSSKQCYTLLAPESWKSASAQKVSQTGEMVKGGSYMFKSGLKLIGT